MIETLIEAVHELKINGWSWATIIILLNLLLKHRSRKRQERMIEAIMKKVGAEYKEPAKIRRIHMNIDFKNINYFSLVPVLLCWAKIISDHFGYHIITDANVNTWANNISYAGGLIGIFMSHTKAAAVAQQVVQELPEIQSHFKLLEADPKMTRQEAIDLVYKVNSALNEHLQHISASRPSDATRNAISLYMTVDKILEQLAPIVPAAAPVEQVPSQMGA